MAGKKDDRPQGPASLPPRKPSLRELFGDGPAPTDVSDTAGPAAPLGTPGGAPERAAPSETASEDGPHPELDFDVFLQRAQTKQKIVPVMPEDEETEADAMEESLLHRAESLELRASRYLVIFLVLVTTLIGFLNWIALRNGRNQDSPLQLVFRSAISAGVEFDVRMDWSEVPAKSTAASVPRVLLSSGPTPARVRLRPGTGDGTRGYGIGLDIPSGARPGRYQGVLRVTPAAEDSGHAGKPCMLPISLVVPSLLSEWFLLRNWLIGVLAFLTITYVLLLYLNPVPEGQLVVRSSVYGDGREERLLPLRPPLRVRLQPWKRSRTDLGRAVRGLKNEASSIARFLPPLWSRYEKVPFTSCAQPLLVLRWARSRGFRIRRMTGYLDPPKMQPTDGTSTGCAVELTGGATGEWIVIWPTDPGDRAWTAITYRR